MANPIRRFQETQETYKGLDAKDRKKFWIDGLLNNGLYIIMFIFILYTAVNNANFVSMSSIINLVTLVAASLPMALGVAGCIVLTGTDLSGGRVIGLTAAVSGALLQSHTVSRKVLALAPLREYVNESGETVMGIPAWWVLITILIVVLIGAAVGFVNGFFVAKFSLHPFIVTLATQLITYSLILNFFQINGNNGAPISGLSDEYKQAVSLPLFRITIGENAAGKPITIAIPMYVLYAVILAVILWFVWNKTTFGKNMFAVGSNAEAAKVSGVNVFWTTTLVHTLAGAMYGFTGFVEGARVGSIAADTGLSSETDAIAACVIGGVSFVGGTGSIGGVVLGVFVLRIIFVALTMLGINPNLQYLIKGAIILVAVALDMRKYLTKK
ncbi:MAG: beta-methylgalactoside transporter [Lachnospiraceae bacterium]|nr:beta-methylgalactoside transporter [Lachnospiraceae bacterium]